MAKIAITKIQENENFLKELNDEECQIYGGQLQLPGTSLGLGGLVGGLVGYVFTITLDDASQEVNIVGNFGGKDINLSISTVLNGSVTFEYEPT